MSKEKKGDQEKLRIELEGEGKSELTGLLANGEHIIINLTAREIIVPHQVKIHDLKAFIKKIETGVGEF